MKVHKNKPIKQENQLCIKIEENKTYPANLSHFLNLIWRFDLQKKKVYKKRYIVSPLTEIFNQYITN